MQSDQAAKENIFYFDQKRLKTTFLGDKRSQSISNYWVALEFRNC